MNEGKEMRARREGRAMWGRKVSQGKKGAMWGGKESQGKKGTM